MLTAIRAPDRRQGVLATVPGNAGRLPQAWLSVPGRAEVRRRAARLSVTLRLLGGYGLSG